MKKIIFGYGSLIGKLSLLKTAPDAKNIRPAYIKGFRREFSLWDSIGYTEDNLDVANIPFTGLDVTRNKDLESRVNGIIFEANGPDLERLLVREQEYLLVKTPAYDYYTEQELGMCEFFSAGKNNAEFCFDLPPQMRYLENMLIAAKSYGDKFYQEFLETTFIKDLALNKEIRLKKFLVVDR